MVALYKVVFLDFTIRQLGKNVPVVLVGNKIDTRINAVDAASLENLIAPVMNDFKVSKKYTLKFRRLNLVLNVRQKNG